MTASVSHVRNTSLAFDDERENETISSDDDERSRDASEVKKLFSAVA